MSLINHLSLALSTLLALMCVYYWWVATGSMTILWLAAFYVFSDQALVKLKEIYAA